jgi:hypothetical protein
VETRRNLWWQNEVLLPRAQPVVAKRGLAALRGVYQRQVSQFKIFILTPGAASKSSYSHQDCFTEITFKRGQRTHERHNHDCSDNDSVLRGAPRLSLTKAPKARCAAFHRCSPPPSHAMLRGRGACRACSASGVWPVPLPQTRSRVPVRCASAVPGCRVLHDAGMVCWLGCAFVRAVLLCVRL